ncbi:MAG: hypothetical protein U0T36_03080 [Saprospiraceae bacterium]
MKLAFDILLVGDSASNVRRTDMRLPYLLHWSKWCIMRTVHIRAVHRAFVVVDLPLVYQAQ